MNILVITRSALDSDNPQISSDGKNIDLQYAKIITNPYDERALEATVKLKQQSTDDITVNTVAIGNNSESLLRNSLARGADDGFYISSDNFYLDDMIIAKAITHSIKTGQIPSPDLIITGLQSTDTNTTFLAPIIARLLNYTCYQAIKKINVCDGNQDQKSKIEVHCNNDCIYQITGNSVISVDYCISTLSFLKLPKIMAAKKKKLHQLDSIQQLQNLEPSYHINNISNIKKQRECIMVEPLELLSLLLSNSKKA